MSKKFSVLMSLYIKEKPEYFRQCMNSILEQTILPDEIVIVKDGPLTDELEAVLAEYVHNNTQLYTIVPLEKNVGLGMALAHGILACRNELIARMDTDDICRKDRFEKQIAMFEQRPELDICSSHIKEFYDTPDVINATRMVPIDEQEILQYQKRRDSFNHVAVMYKKAAVLGAGNYQHALLMEDSLLWVNMMRNGAKCANVDDYLVYVRTGRDMYARRGGLSYFKKYRSGRKEIYKTGYISYWDYLYTLMVQLVVALLPNSLRRFVFNKLLRNQK